MTVLAVIGFFAILYALHSAIWAAWRWWQARPLRPALERLADPTPLPHELGSVRLYRCGCARTWCELHAPERWADLERQMRNQP